MPATRPDQPRSKRIEIEADWQIVALNPPPRRLVLAAVVGESPAVVTETLWSLFNRGPSEDPERLVIFTTTAGRQLMCKAYDDPNRVPRDRRKQPLSALGSRHYPWEDDDLILALCRLCREWSRPVPIVDIHVPCNEHNEEITDIRTEADDRAFGNLIFREIRELTKDEGVEVHASVAGGRKTMGTRLASVLSMFGRPQDELSHVLVTNPDYENPGYWCPSKQAGNVYVKPVGQSRRSVQVGDPSVVQLVRQRFWPLRNVFSVDDLKLIGEVDFDELVLAINAVIDPPPISFNDAAHMVLFGTPGHTFFRSLQLPVKRYALYRALVEIRVVAADVKPDDGEQDSDAIRPGYVDALDFGPVEYDPKAKAAATANDFRDASKHLLTVVNGISQSEFIAIKDYLYVREENWRYYRDRINYDVTEINKNIDEVLIFSKLRQHYKIRTHSKKDAFDKAGKITANGYWRIGIEIDKARIAIQDASAEGVAGP